jgi:acetyl-CoA carboxylase biotin carboxyl carrier protein
MNLKEIKELIELVSEKGFTEFEIERQGFRLRICRADAQHPTGQAIPPIILATPAPALQLPSTPTVTEAPHKPAEATPAEQAPEEKEKSSSAELHIIKSPMVGTFYRSPSPTSEPFVQLGDHVEPDTVVCIIEAMKLMNQIEAEVSGEITEIYAENGQPVEYGQPLFGVKVS